MATLDIDVAGRRYSVSCRDGEEQHLLSVAALVDGKARDAAAALGSLSETRQLLFAALLLADEVKEQRAGRLPTPAAAPDLAVADGLERLAGRIEALADRLEGMPATP
ncbi:MAG TPA: cell division protein ZapA [Allosphingosinicella sp.]|jgi:cell division protein ZapA